MHTSFIQRLTFNIFLMIYLLIFLLMLNSSLLWSGLKTKISYVCMKFLKITFFVMSLATQGESKADKRWLIPLSCTIPYYFLNRLLRFDHALLTSFMCHHVCLYLFVSVSITNSKLKSVRNGKVRYIIMSEVPFRCSRSFSKRP